MKLIGYLIASYIVSYLAHKVLSLHGMGPNAIRKLKEEMARRGISFADR